MRDSIEVALFSVEMTVAKHNIKIPCPGGLHKFCTVSYYSEKDSYLTAFTVVEYTGCDFGIILEGDKFLTVVNYVYRLVKFSGGIKSSHLSETLWVECIVPHMCNTYNGQVRKYGPAKS